MSIIQWNCRGLRANFEEVKLLISSFSPSVICLQETFVKAADLFSIRGFQGYFSPASDSAAGGVAILIRDALSSPVSLSTSLQAVAVRVTLHRPLTICCLYVPPSYRLHPQLLKDLIVQLPPPFLLLGDFNAHSPLWGDVRTCSKGLIVEDFLIDNDLFLFNDLSPTYLHPATGTFTAIDLSICSPSVALDFSWRVLGDSHGSDHFPIVLCSSEPSVSSRPPRWQLRKANWEEFQRLCNERLSLSVFDGGDDPVAVFSDVLRDIASVCIPQTSTVPRRLCRPWFTDECRVAIRQRKRALRVFKRFPTPENLQRVKRSRAFARRTVRAARRRSWREFVSRLSSRTPVRKTWDMVRKISGKSVRSPPSHLVVDGRVVESLPEVAAQLARSFSRHSSAESGSRAFQRFRAAKEKTPLPFESDDSEVYNAPFSARELHASLNRAHNTSPGPDNIPYEFLKHLPMPSFNLLLHIFNSIWCSGSFPPSWREAVVIPVPKPGKDATVPSNYRPIALTSCVCKTFERMVNDRLVWFLESKKLITSVQCGFRKRRSTLDHLVRLEALIREGFVRRQHCVGVFFDLEKAYDTTWKYGILSDMFSMGLRGRLPLLIKEFLCDRIFKVRLGSCLSGSYPQEMGVPQGSILSVTLFSIKINSIVRELSPNVESFLYVDDFLIICRSCHMTFIQRQLQCTLDKLQGWSDKNGFKFSKSKTVCVHFCQIRGLHPDPDLRLDGALIPVVEQTRFLGLLFDRKLSFIPQIKSLRLSCSNALNLIRVVSNCNWGGSSEVLLRLYRALVRSKLDYGSVVYGSARRSYLSRLDPIHHKGIRLSLGAFRTSPVESLYAEAREPSLYLRRRQLSLKYYIKLSAFPSNPAFNHVVKPGYGRLFERQPRSIPPLGMRVVEDLDSANLRLPILTCPLYLRPPWLMPVPVVSLFLCEFVKRCTLPHVFRGRFYEFLDKHKEFYQIYTDGSRDGDRVAAAVVARGHVSRSRLPDGASVYSAELSALESALEFAWTKRLRKVLVVSDSLSALQALRGGEISHPYLYGIFLQLCRLDSLGSEVVFCWVPSHMGIPGNERADQAAKSALSLPPSSGRIPATDLYPRISSFVQGLCQTDWDGRVLNKLHEVSPRWGERCSPPSLSRREEVVLCRARIGHSFLTHSFLLRAEPPPVCRFCQCRLTMRHILVECPRLAQLRGGNTSLSSFFQDPLTVIKFLRESQYFAFI